MPKKIKVHNFVNCRTCFKKLTGNQTSYCSDNCKQQYRQLKTKFEKLKEKNPNLTWITWDEKDNPNEKLEWRKIKGIENQPEYKVIKKIVTKQKPKRKKTKKINHLVSSSTS